MGGRGDIEHKKDRGHMGDRGERGHRGEREHRGKGGNRGHNVDSMSMFVVEPFPFTAVILFYD